MNHVSKKNPAAEAEAMEAVERHHANMLRRLTALADAVTGSVEKHDASAEHDAHEVLLEWCENELVPHALAEEGPLYSGPRNSAEGRLLVEGMLAEHQVIVALVEELRGARGVAAAVAAGAIQRIFALQLDKENRLLMPFVAASPGLSLAEAVSGLHELVGDGHTHPGGSAHGHHA
ncbi:DNA-binding FadR family transcriptional regulator [Arthrobacter sp. PvP023]|uniref:hemerythrin domain-containing protein n=1 Tax=Micrococcaceae TaxID=1268 RepID=UPI001AE4B43D|nr:hemerythrin domain-containing protein [Arthrobacter sp. PvP023]MBP1136189.1 DNA-binding FadR family transcriptional regulator [Arthrobacter sp. PvP023]